MKELKKTSIKIWEKIDINLDAKNKYANPYTEVVVWVDLKGPGFDKRVYGFWNGESEFCIRATAVAPGKWSWVSGSNQADSGLNDKKGSFTAVEPTEEEKLQNPCRRGFLKASENEHALEYADGTPYFLLGDTWWSVPTFRFRWYDDDQLRPIGPDMGFKDMVKYRKSQGFNCIAIIAALPAWANDGKPEHIVMDDEDKTVIRSAWKQPGTESAEDMYNEGGRSFFFPGKVPGYEDVVPDFDRINPEYFKHMDKKIDYLNLQGFIPFIEVARRDISQAWKRYNDWPKSYTRYIQYVFSRYQANNCILSPIHMDSDHSSIPTHDYNAPANLVSEFYGPQPFSTLVSSNAHLSNLRNFGGPEEAKWLTVYQTGNWREHEYYWYLTEIFNQPEPHPALNGEPYYAWCPLGWPHKQKPTSAEEDEAYCRSGMYGSVLSGGLAGHIYGAEGLWQGAVEPEAKIKIWESLVWESANQMQHLKTFIFSQGGRYKELIPNADYITPSKWGDPIGYKGWSYCAGTPERDFFLLYFEKNCPRVTFRGSEGGKDYTYRWFNPRTGEWSQEGTVVANNSTGRIILPEFPTDEDWGMSLVLKEK